MRKAQEHAALARKLDLEAGYTRRAAVTQAMLAWLDFMFGKFEEATRAIRDASSVLAATDDHVAKANLLAFHGRLERRRGRYDESAEHFENAIGLFESIEPGHRNLARARINYAVALLMQGRKLQDSKSSRQQFNNLHNTAERQLALAEHTYGALGNERGMATIHNVRASLAYERNDYTGAQQLALKACSKAGDHYGIIANSMIVMALSETAQEENASRQQALTFAERARECAERYPTDARLSARVRIANAIALLLPPASEAARTDAEVLYREATKLLSPWDQDYVRDELEQLRRTLTETLSDDQVVVYRVKASDLMDRSLEDEILPEIADAVIRAAYEQNGRKISRTAKALKCGPPRVRQAIYKNRPR